jgi:hypothetical protein
LLAEAYYLNRDYGQAAKELSAEVQADETAGRPPRRIGWSSWPAATCKQKDTPGVVTALEKLVTYYPKTGLLGEPAGATSRPGRASCHVWRSTCTG